MSFTHPNPIRTIRRVLAVALGAVALMCLTGCWIPALVGGMAQSAHETGSTLKFAEYEDLMGNDYAVVVKVTRGIAGEFPSLAGVMTNAIARRMVTSNDKIQATGFVPGALVLEFQYSTPSWEAWTYGKLAQHFGVTRLIIVDIHEFRLYEPGNRYVWNGRVAVRIGIVDADDPGAVDFSFTKDLYIRYPDDDGYTMNDMSTNNVIANLQERVANRVAWTFFDHEEPNIIPY